MASTGRVARGIVLRMNGKHHVYARMTSPVGTLTLVGDRRGLSAILWEDDRPRRVPARRWTPRSRVIPCSWRRKRQLTEYFAGTAAHASISTFDVAGTAFQRRSGTRCCTIPFGETRSYSADRRADRPVPRAVRAVGAANGRNPLSIVAPCHRVIGANGALTGFAGGLDVKARLLALERVGASSSR